MSVRTPDPNPGPDRDPQYQTGWLSEEELSAARQRLPMLYVEAVPVRLDGLGQLTEVGLLLRVGAGGVVRTVVSGRVLYGESLREALSRHVTKDLGPMAFPQLPPVPTPFHVAEYTPLPGEGPYTDERQHAVSLCYIVPVTGACEPRQDALEITWMGPDQAASEMVSSEMEGGRGTLIRAALAHLGALR